MSRRNWIYFKLEYFLEFSERSKYFMISISSCFDIFLSFDHLTNETFHSSFRREAVSTDQLKEFYATRRLPSTSLILKYGKVHVIHFNVISQFHLIWVLRLCSVEYFIEQSELYVLFKQPRFQFSGGIEILTPSVSTGRFQDFRNVVSEVDNRAKPRGVLWIAFRRKRRRE